MTLPFLVQIDKLVQVFLSYTFTPPSWINRLTLILFRVPITLPAPVALGDVLILNPCQPASGVADLHACTTAAA